MNRQSPKAGGLQPLELANAQPTQLKRVTRVGVEPITPILQGSVAPIGMQAQLKRSVRELNPIFALTTDVCCHNTYRPSNVPGWS